MTIEAVPGGVRIHLHVQPGASSTEVAGLHGERVKLRIQSPPVDGRANAAVIAWASSHFGVPSRAVTLVRGEKSREKTIVVEGVTIEMVRERLND